MRFLSNLSHGHFYLEHTSWQLLLYASWWTLHRICKNTGFRSPIFSRLRFSPYMGEYKSMKTIFSHILCTGKGRKNETLWKTTCSDCSIFIHTLVCLRTERKTAITTTKRTLTAVKIRSNRPQNKNVINKLRQSCFQFSILKVLNTGKNIFITYKSNSYLTDRFEIYDLTFKYQQPKLLELFFVSKVTIIQFIFVPKTISKNVK